MDGGRPTTCTEKRQPMCDRDRIGRQPQIPFGSQATVGDELLTAHKLWLLSGVARYAHPTDVAVVLDLFQLRPRPERNGDVDVRREGGRAAARIL
jgi:hypothetical protein